MQLQHGGQPSFRQQGPEQGEQEAPGEFTRELKSWREAQLREVLQNTLGCLPQGWFAVASGHHTWLKAGTETTYGTGLSWK